jgi:hypothetical protein
MTNKLTLDQAEEIAREATQKELEKYEIPSDLSGKVVLTTVFEKNDRIFLLYIPGESRHNPTMIAKTRVNIVSGEVCVEVPGWERKLD